MAGRGRVGWILWYGGIRCVQYWSKVCTVGAHWCLDTGLQCAGEWMLSCCVVKQGASKAVVHGVELLGSPSVHK